MCNIRMSMKHSSTRAGIKINIQQEEQWQEPMGHVIFIQNVSVLFSFSFFYILFWTSKLSMQVMAVVQLLPLFARVRPRGAGKNQ